jgi:antitoxin CptB
MRELDELLVKYLDGAYPDATEPEKAAFRSLLTLPDPELIGYLLGQQVPPAELDIVIQRIRSGTET